MIDTKNDGAFVARSARIPVVLFVSLLFTLLPGTVVRADWVPRVGVLPSSSGVGGALAVNDRVIARLRLSADYMPPGERLRDAAARIEQQLRLFPGKVTVEASKRTEGKDSVVRLNGMPVLIATVADAKEQDGSSLKLARHWATLLRSAASLPALRLSERRIIVPLGESRTISVRGVARGPLQLPTSEELPVAASVASAGQIRLTGRTIGTQKLTVEREGAAASIDVTVEPWAGFISAPAPLVLTGSTIDASTRRDLANASVRTAIHLTPGASLKLPNDSPPFSPSVGSQDSKTVATSRSTLSIPVVITGPSMLPRRTEVRVHIKPSTPPRILPATTLLYSNDPEGITHPQVLFTARVGDARKGSTRLLYHHQSRLTTNAVFQVDLLNEDEKPARLHLRGGMAGPVRDTVWAGYRAGEAFLQALSDGSGYFLDIPARSRIRIAAARLPAGQTVSGLQELIQTVGAPIQVRVAVVAETNGETESPLFTPEPLPVQNEIVQVTSVSTKPLAVSPSDARFAAPHLTFKNEYRVGERWDFVTIGHGQTNAANLIGAYGYIYDIEWNLVNPTKKSASVRISFTPTAGLASGVFWIDGKIVERVPQAQEQQEIQLYRVQLGPGEHRKVRIRTIPLAGSNYPARLVVHP